MTDGKKISVNHIPFIQSDERHPYGGPREAWGPGGPPPGSYGRPPMDVS